MEAWKLILMALGIVLVIEGMPYALYPGGMKKVLGQVFLIPNRNLRFIGLGLIVIGFCIVILVRR